MTKVSTPEGGPRRKRGRRKDWCRAQKAAIQVCSIQHYVPWGWEEGRIKSTTTIAKRQEEGRQNNKNQDI